MKTEKPELKITSVADVPHPIRGGARMACERVPRQYGIDADRPNVEGRMDELLLTWALSFNGDIDRI